MMDAAKCGLCEWCLCPLPRRHGSVSSVVLEDFVGPEEMCDSEYVTEDGQHYWLCTREKGHDGEHVQCGMCFHDVGRWR